MSSLLKVIGDISIRMSYLGESESGALSLGVRIEEKWSLGESAIACGSSDLHLFSSSWVTECLQGFLAEVKSTVFSQI